jgi:regulator of protease activity HflC (stomatin/prohibitin superfamily)
MLFIISLLAAVVAIFIFLNAKKKYNKQEITFSSIGIVVASVVAVSQFWTVIPAGHVGVVDFFGVVSDNTLYPGVNLVNPIANIIKFDARTQELKEEMTVPSKEGLTVQLEISILFSLSFENANKIYKTVGEDYVEKILIPQFRSVVRGVTARYEARSLYTADREKLAKEIEEELASLVGPRGITLEAAPMRQIKLPAGLTASIEEKLKSEQESQRMTFILERERQEAERKRIEAKGISDFQTIVSQGLSEQILRWKGIEATEKLANSQNSKVIVIGSGKDGLPIILGNDK